MSFLEEVKNALRIRHSNIYDVEIDSLIQACFYDLKRLGISFDEDDVSPEIKMAVFSFVKANMGVTDVDKKTAFWDAYNRQRKALMMDLSKRGE